MSSLSRSPPLTVGLQKPSDDPSLSLDVGLAESSCRRYYHLPYNTFLAHGMIVIFWKFFQKPQYGPIPTLIR